MIKYTICICDDEEEIRKRLRKYIVQYSFTYDVEIEIIELERAEKLLELTTLYDILFLDIRFGDRNIGIDIAENLRLLGNTAIIVIITSFSALSIDGYRAEPFRFIIKPFKEERIKSLLSECLSKLNRTVTYLKVTSDYNTEMLRTDKILYIFSKQRKRQIICRNKKIVHTWQSLNELMESLPVNKFAYSQKSYIINLDAVDTVINDKIALSNNEIVPLGMRYKDAFMKALQVHMHD